MGSSWVWKEQQEKRGAEEHPRLKVWCGRCWTYVDPPHDCPHDCNNPHRPQKDEPKLVFP